jgi:hypothetical protein
MYLKGTFLLVEPIIKEKTAKRRFNIIRDVLFSVCIHYEEHVLCQ